MVENQVNLIYTRVYAKLRNEIFFDIHALNKAIKEKTKAHNQTRMQQKPYSREENFLANEKHLLAPLPVEPSIDRCQKQPHIPKPGQTLLQCSLHTYRGKSTSDLHPKYGLYLCGRQTDCRSQTRLFSGEIYYKKRPPMLSPSTLS